MVNRHSSIANRKSKTHFLSLPIASSSSSLLLRCFFLCVEYKRRKKRSNIINASKATPTTEFPLILPIKVHQILSHWRCFQRTIFDQKWSTGICTRYSSVVFPFFPMLIKMTRREMICLSLLKTEEDVILILDIRHCTVSNIQYTSAIDEHLSITKRNDWNWNFEFCFSSSLVMLRRTMNLVLTRSQIHWQFYLKHDLNRVKYVENNHLAFIVEQ